MADHIVTLHITGPDELPEVEWQELLDNDGYESVLQIDYIENQTFPWKDVHHEIRWWITKPLTQKEWRDLDKAESEAIYSVIGDNFIGTAGPIPLSDV